MVELERRRALFDSDTAELIIRVCDAAARDAYEAVALSADFHER
jgi:hypothetical protein